MILLNLGCGDVRPPSPWINVDNLADVLDDRTYGFEIILDRLKGEDNYFHMDMRKRDWPWPDNSVDGIASHHCFEHFDAVDLQEVLKECYRILKPGGVLRCSVPDASYFRQVHTEDNHANAVRLFGEPILHPEYATMMGWALFLYQDHRQVFTEDSLWCTLVNRECPRAGSFAPEDVVRAQFKQTTRPGHYCAEHVAQIERRAEYSLIMEAFKS